MKIFVFELKRLLKNHSIILLMIMAIMLSILNVSLNNSYNYEQEIQGQAVESYPMMFLMTLTSISNPDGNSYEPSPGYLKYLEIYQDDRYMPMETPLGYPIGPLELEREYIEAAFQIDQIELTDSEQASLAYMNEVGSITHSQKNTFSGFIQYLLLGNQSLYGGIALLLIVLVLLRLEEENVKQQKLFYHTLPLNRKSLIRVKLPLALALSLIYLVTVIITTLIISLMQDGEMATWSFPLRNLYSQTFLLPFILISMIAIVFVLKVLMLVSFSYFILSVLKDVRLTQLIILMLVLLGIILTNFYAILQVNWNPLFVNAFEQFLGKLVLDPAWQPLTRYIHTGSPISPLILGLWSIATIIMIELAAHRINQPANLILKQTSKQKQPINHLSLNSLQALESAKLHNIMSFPKGFIVILVPVTVLLVLMLVQDQQAERHLLSSIAFDQDYQSMQEYYEKQINDHQKLQEEAENQGNYDLSQMYQAIIASDEVALQYVHDLYQPISKRRVAYQAEDGKSYYETFHSELAIWYNPNNRYSMADQLYWMPRPDYYHNGDYPTLFGYHVSQERLELMQERQIRPLAGAGISLTPYDQAVSPASQMQDRITYQLSDQSALGILFRFFHVYRLDLILMVALLIFVGAGYSMEGSHNDHLKWLYTLPINRHHLHHTKWLASIRLSMKYILWTLILLASIGFLLDGIGQGSLPILRYQQILANPNMASQFEHTYQWIGLAEYLIQTLILLSLSVIFILTLSLFLSQWQTNTMTLYVITLSICVLGYILSTKLGYWNRFLPFMYLNVSQFIDGSLIFQYEIERLPFITAVMVLCAYTLIIHSLSLITITYRRKGGL